jgi:flagellar basal-body rod protein FlgF
MQTQIYVGLSSQLALRQQLDVLANNIANVNTVGFRAESVLFDSHLEKTQDRQNVAYVVDKFSYTDRKAGTFRETGNPLDVAIRGEGWLQVQTENGARFTRDGRLHLNPAGTLVNHMGYEVLGAGGGPVEIPDDAGTLQVMKDGTIGDGERVFGRIEIVQVADEGAMAHEAGGLYAGGGAVAAAEGIELMQGTLELSNVNAVLAMTQLIDISAAYQRAQTLVEGSDETARNAIRTIGRIE